MWAHVKHDKAALSDVIGGGICTDRCKPALPPAWLWAQLLEPELAVIFDIES
jgi:hypothetical protein